MFKLAKENLRISLESVKSHFLRTTLTAMIIALGITALVGILTSMDAIEYYLTDNFTMMGANTFTIKNRSMRIQIGNKVNKARNYEPISFDEATNFKSSFDFPAATSVYTFATHIATLKYLSEKTNPNVAVLGTDENYIHTSGGEINKGRNFTTTEVFYGSHVVVLGSELEKKLFKDGVDPIGKVVSIGPGKYRVIGVLKEKGSSLGFSGDRNCLVPLNNARQYFARPNQSYTINVVSYNPAQLESSLGVSGVVSSIFRGTFVGDEHNFESP